MDAAPATLVPLTAFRQAEKRFKACKSLESLGQTDIIDVLDPVKCQLLFDRQFSSPNTRTDDLIDCSMLAQRQRTVFASSRRPGVFFIPNAFTPEETRTWLERAICEYTVLKNPSNLDPHYNMPESERSRWHEGNCECTITPTLSCRAVFNKLRWVTLGWHYDWTAKIYPAGRVGEFPHELARLARGLFAFTREQSTNEQYQAEAAIVNYYHPGDTLAGHTDYSEQNHKAPLISISLGLSAVFLLGGLTRDEPPDALLLRNGDVIIMEEQARLSYHGVPAVFANSVPDDVLQQLLQHAPKLAEFAKSTRVNINIRQVF